jgi:hypothetical protein
MTESETDAFRYYEDQRATRERFGKPVFKDRQESKILVASISSAIDKVLKHHRPEIQDNILKLRDKCQQVGLPITPRYIAAMECVAIADFMRRKYLQSLVGAGKVDQYVMSDAAGKLDVLQGFEITMASLMRAFIAPDEREELPGLCVDLELSKSDPNGFRSIKKQIEFLKSPLRMEEESVEPYEDQGLIVAGAELGAKTYKRMYPIAERVLSSGR